MNSAGRGWPMIEPERQVFRATDTCSCTLGLARDTLRSHTKSQRYGSDPTAVKPRPTSRRSAARHRPTSQRIGPIRPTRSDTPERAPELVRFGPPGIVGNRRTLLRCRLELNA